MCASGDNPPGKAFLPTVRWPSIGHRARERGVFWHPGYSEDCSAVGKEEGRGKKEEKREIKEGKERKKEGKLPQFHK